MAGARRRVLVIEDDPETAEHLVGFLRTSGYQIDLAADDNDGFARAIGEYAVMTIDRMLPGIDGLMSFAGSESEGIVTPALIVSALGEKSMTASVVCAPAVTIIWSNPSPLRSCSPASKLSPGAAGSW